MPRVLIPTDVQDYAIHLIEAYRRLGWEAVAGKWNFHLDACGFNLVHLQWPEEFSTSWLVIKPGEVEAIAARLEAWRTKSKIIATVHNLYPHLCENDAGFRRLFERFYSGCDVIHHFCDASRRAMVERYPALASCNHLVTSPFNYDRLLPRRRAPRRESRQKYGLSDGEFVVLVFGSIRDWREIELLRNAWQRVKTPRKRLLVTARYQEPLPRAQRHWREWRWQRWIAGTGAVDARGYVPDEGVYRLFDAADAVVLPRIGAMSSGLPNMAMTMGAPMVMPEQGVFPEYLAGSRNLLYKPGDAASFADAIDAIAALDRDAVGVENRRIADGWTWDAMVARCVQVCGLG